MPTRCRGADDMIASLMQEMGQQQGYQNDKTAVGGDWGNETDGMERRRASQERKIQELSNYPDNTYKAGSQSIWNPLVKGECGSTRTIAKNPSSTTSSFLLPTNPRIEVTRRRVFEKFRQEVQTLLQDFQTKSLSFAPSSSGDSSSFSKNKNKLPIPSMIEKWQMDAKLEERNYLLKKTMATTEKLSQTKSEGGNSEYRPASLLSTTDILRERAWRKEHDQPIYDPILLNKHAPQIFVDTILKPQVKKIWQQVEHTTNHNLPMPPKFNKKAGQVQKGLYRLICEAIDSFESQLLQGAREESMRSTATRKNRRNNQPTNKRPKITIGQAEGDDSSQTSMVRVSFSGVTLKLHRAYLEKLQRLHDRTADQRERTGDSGSVSSSYHHLSFEEALFCLLCRYDMIQGAGLQAGVPGAIMDVLLERFDCRMECFASPFNCRYDCFASAFEDVDAPFGSKGSFFELPVFSEDSRGESRADNDDSGDDDNRSTTSREKGICFEANPPFCDGNILQLDQKLTSILSLKERKTPIMFVVFVPAWRDSECYQALLANPCLTKQLLLKQGEHWYAEGTQHRRKDSFRVASFDTSILFYQNDSAKKLWNLKGDDNPTFLELRSAFGQDPGKVQKAEESLQNRSKRIKEKSLATNLSTLADRDLTTPCQSFPTTDRKKESSAMRKRKVGKAKKPTKVKKRHLNNPKEEGTAQLALLESLGLSSTTTVPPPASEKQKSSASGKTTRKHKKRRKK